MVSMISSSLSFLLFNVAFFLLVMGNFPSDAPTPATMPSSSSSAPATVPSSNSPAPESAPCLPAPLPSSNSSAPASASASSLSPASCKCSLNIKTVVACSVVLIQGGRFGLPQNICCNGLKGLSKEDVYSCLCYVIKSNVMGQPVLDLTIPAAVKIVSLACGF